jgi:GNAT superfamily N-acetyltransferase
MSSDDPHRIPMVRDALGRDAAAVRDVASAAWRDTYAGLLGAATIESFVASAYSIERLERRIAGHTFLVVEDGHAVVAFADAIREPDHVNLVAIYALPEWRGRGAGTALLDLLRARFPDLPIAADVLVGNAKGETFYEHRGFVPRERLEEELFGEAVLERRWWLGAPPSAGS